MANCSPMNLVFLTLLTFFASGVGTLTGFGTSTLMVPVLVNFFSVGETLLVVGIIHWFGDLWKVLLFREGLRGKLVLGFGIAGILGSVVGANVVFAVPEQLLSRILGFFLVLYVSILFINPSFQVPQDRLSIVMGGCLSGFLAGIFGVGGAVRGAFLNAFHLPKAVYIATSGAIALLIDSSRLITYVANGAALSPELKWGLLVMIPSSFVGAQLSKLVVDKLSQNTFRLIIAIFLLLIGLKLLLPAITP